MKLKKKIITGETEERKINVESLERYRCIMSRREIKHIFSKILKIKIKYYSENSMGKTQRQIEKFRVLRDFKFLISNLFNILKK